MKIQKESIILLDKLYILYLQKFSLSSNHRYPLINPEATDRRGRVNTRAPLKGSSEGLTVRSVIGRCEASQRVRARAHCNYS